MDSAPKKITFPTSTKLSLRLLYTTGIFLFLFTGCITKPAQKKSVRTYSKPIITKQQQTRYKQLLRSFQLGVGDIIAIKVYGEPNLKGTFQIYPNCLIQFPLIKDVKVCGRTPGEIRTDIAIRLHKKYFQARPSVSIKVEQYNSKKIHVLGQVKKAGRFTYSPGLTLIQAIAMAGGFTDRAAAADTRLIRTSQGAQRVYRINLDGLGSKRVPDVSLRPGDVIVIPQSWL